MAAFNYRQLIRQIPARTWEFYFQSRKLGGLKSEVQHLVKQVR